ncbi:MAG TPA: hypothetical protein VFZ53_01830 [Polyangiaceae bacterium]
MSAITAVSQRAGLLRFSFLIRSLLGGLDGRRSLSAMSPFWHCGRNKRKCARFYVYSVPRRCTNGSRGSTRRGERASGVPRALRDSGTSRERRPRAPVAASWAAAMSGGGLATKERFGSMFSRFVRAERFGAWVSMLIALGAGVASCSGRDAGAPAPRSVERRSAAPAGVSAPPAARAPSKLAEPSDFEVAIADRAVLAALETNGFGFASLVFGATARTTAELAALPGAKSIFDVLRDDVRATKRTHPLAKVTSMDGFRLFDERWLASDEMRLELVGVFNRLDRRAFYPGTCGEVRFVYRLAYRTTHAGAVMAGPLPFTVNAVFLVRGDARCAAVARAWQRPEGAPSSSAEWLVNGPLSVEARRSWELKSIETNLQSFRLQSFVHPTLAGHIDYELRVFRAKTPARDAFVPAPMENMPDVAKLSGDAKLRSELLATLRDPATLAAIDRGTLNLPDRFLSTRAVSVSPRGLTRPANRPFRSLFRAEEFRDAPLAGTRTIATPAALLRRLDGATCVGCHQSRSIAGFHFAGDSAPEHPPFDALLSGSSPHLEADLERRRAYVASVANEREPDEFRPVPERQAGGSGFGAACGLGDAGFAAWTCAAGLRCEKLEDAEVGVCLTDAAIGSPCQYGEVVAASAPHRDQVARLANHACVAAQRCDNNKSGFPLGSCSGACTATKDGVCADFLDADAFQNCLRAKKTFGACAKDHVFGAGLRACDADEPCRQDYVCVRSRTAEKGACVPPYFVYQLRLDGYPLPR